MLWLCVVVLCGDAVLALMALCGGTGGTVVMLWLCVVALW